MNYKLFFFYEVPFVVSLLVFRREAARALEERSDDVGISRPAGPGILERSEKIRKGGKAEGG